MKRIPFLFLFIVHHIVAQNLQLKDFQNPPNAAKPRVWWHWMNGNITKEGIQKDLEWFSKTGIGGFQNFDANLQTPVIVPNKLVFMTPEWKDAFQYTTSLAQQKGLEMAIAGSPGFSVTGGPWVKPEDGIKKYVWSETHIQGGKTININLTKPSNTAGKFQSAPMRSEAFFYKYVGEAPKFFQDTKVIAFKLPTADILFSDLRVKVSSSGGEFDFKNLTDNDVANAVTLPPMAVGEDMWIQYEFEEPISFKAVSLAGASNRGASDFAGVALNRTLKVSNDGVNFKEIAKFTASNLPLNTISFEPTQAKYWRVCFKTLPPPFQFMAAMTGGKPTAEKSDGVDIAEFILHSTERIDQAEDKAGFTPWHEDNTTFLPKGSDAIPINDVVDITDKMDSNGVLNWNVPLGNWAILRFGYSLTGRQNHPASPEATGLEVDKLDKEAVKRYINTYLDMYKEATGGIMGEQGLQYMILDSYEAGHMTWTKKMPEEFRKRRGYNLIPWMPTLTGRIVSNVEDTEKFLWDFRKTIGEMIAEYHYDIIDEELHKRGMKSYTESHEGGRIYLADGMDVKRHADIPTSAMWTPGSLAAGGNEEIRSEADIRESASVAHIYGKTIVAAESMTAIQNAFSWYPEKLKRTADLEMASGLNRFIIHTSVHQPLDDKKPGFTLGPFGQYFTRHETWSGAGAKAWMTYLGRSCYMLQQGKNVADVLYFYGENTNVTWQFKDKLPKIEGYEYDFCNSTALQLMKVENGKIVAPSGSSYSLLVLDQSAKLMTLPVLKKIKDLVKAGAKVAGIKPEKSPSLSDNTAEFQTIVNEIWGQNPKLQTQNYAEILRGGNVPEDVIIKNAKSTILYIHRSNIRNAKAENVDIYWVSSRSTDKNEAEISFRISDRIPELWHPQTGKTEKLSYKIEHERTIIPLKFEPWEAYFIIFKEKTKINAFIKPVLTEKPIFNITGSWKVDFPNIGSIDIQKLNSWTELTEIPNPKSEMIKYFSGTATYQNTFKMEKIDKKTKYEIDLGEVKNIAEVFINGKNMGTVWKTPFKLDITEGVKKGINTLDIKVTNLWVNRLIGDAQPEVKQKTTYTVFPFYKANTPLLPSGLLGPVQITSILNK